jgi:hypothetical protein
MSFMMASRIGGGSIIISVRPSGIQMPIENPYAPPTATIPGKTVDCDARWYLTRIQKCFRRMGIGALVYIVVAIVVTTTIEIRRPAIRIPQTVGPLVWSAIFGWIFLTMIRLGRLPEEEFPKHYKKARWITILAGTIFLPILGIPAYISLRRLTLYNEARKSNT